jgi:two-component system OmpR family response regulator
VLKQGTGLGVLARLGRAGAGPRFVVLSNYATPDVSRRALALGASRVFDKSNDIDALIDYCRQLAQQLGAAPAPDAAGLTGSVRS